MLKFELIILSEDEKEETTVIPLILLSMDYLYTSFLTFLKIFVIISFQDYRLLMNRTVYDNVAFALEVIEVPTKKIRRSVPAALNLVGLAHKTKSLPYEISGGEQQRTAIARAIVNNPSVVLADEPTGNLDPRNSEEIMEVLDAINRRGTTVIVATHDRQIVNEMQKRIIHLDHGVIVRDSVGGYDDEN